MLRQSPNTNSPSSREEDVVSLENRRNKAESEFIILLEDKKRISLEMEEMDSKTRQAKKTLNEVREEIFETKGFILEVQKSLRNERQLFETEVTKNKEFLAELSVSLAQKAEEKKSMEDSFMAVSKSHEVQKFSMSQENKDLENERFSLLEKKKKLEETCDSLVKQEADLSLLLSEAEEKRNKFREIESLLEKQVIVLQNKVEDLGLVIGSKKEAIDKYDEVLKEKEEDIAAWNSKIMLKEQEYKTVESKAFVILNREENIRNKEAFIKSQYERAGIKWEE